MSFLCNTRCGIALFVLATCSSRPSNAPGPTTADVPPHRAHHALVYDETRGRILLTGGSTPTNGGQRFTMFNDLWEFDGTRWSALTASGTRMSGMRLVWDRRRNRVVSFGGYDGGLYGDLRVLTNGSWQTLGSHPEVRAAESGFVYDSPRDRFVLFGGAGAAGRVADANTWEYDGTSWTKRAITNPPPRQAHAMVFDESRRRTVLFGGLGNASSGQPPPVLGDLWEYDGNAWVRRDAPNGPTARSTAGAAYDSKRNLVILFGGLDAAGFKGDTWSWDGTSWRLLSETGPPPRGMGYLAYDRQRDRMVLFGGRNGWPNGDLNDTWEWDGTTWREVVK